MNIRYFSKNLCAALFGMLLTAGCLPEVDFVDYNRPFYPYGGLASGGERWVFVIDHRNDYFSADRTYDPADIDDDTDDVFPLHIEGTFDYAISGAVELTVTKSDDDSDVSVGTVLDGYMAEGQLFYILPDADGSTGAFADGFIGVNVSNDCSDDEGWLELAGGDSVNYNWLSAGYDSADPVIQWGNALFSIETDETILAAVDLLNESGDAQQVLGSFIDTLYRWDLFEATVEVESPTDDSPADDGQLVLSTCLLADMVSFQADDSIISGGSIDDSVAILSRYGFFSADKRAVLDGGTVKKPKIFLPAPLEDSEIELNGDEMYTGVYSEMISGGRNAIFQMTFDAGTDTAYAVELEEGGDCFATADEVQSEANLFQWDISGYNNGVVSGSFYFDDGTGSIDQATELDTQSLITDFLLTTTRFAPDKKPKQKTQLVGQVGGISGINADNNPFLILFSSDYCINR